MLFPLDRKYVIINTLYLNKEAISLKSRITFILSILLSTMLCFSSCTDFFNVSESFENNQTDSGLSNSEAENTAESLSSGDMSNGDVGELTISIIDVGQGDAILVKTPGGKFVLIDAGVNTAKSKVLDFLNANGVDRLDCAFFTHPHADHIGAAAEVVDSYKPDKVYMPNTSHTTKTFENLLAALERSPDTEVIEAKRGESLELDGVLFTVLSPIDEKYSDLNGYSIVLHIVYGSCSFLMMGDAEMKNEMQILDTGDNLKADFIKLGHHGSSTSSARAFIAAVDPAYAAISCGTDNSYGHPHEQTLTLLAELGIDVSRTDLNGTITVRSNGKTISVECEKN